MQITPATVALTLTRSVLAHAAHAYPTRVKHKEMVLLTEHDHMTGPVSTYMVNEDGQMRCITRNLEAACAAYNAIAV